MSPLSSQTQDSTLEVGVVWRRVVSRQRRSVVDGQVAAVYTRTIGRRAWAEAARRAWWASWRARCGRGVDDDCGGYVLELGYYCSPALQYYKFIV